MPTLPAVLRHNRSVNAARLAGCALLSCSPPGSARPRSPASSRSPAKASANGMPLAGWRPRCPAQPRAERPHPKLSDRQLVQVEQALLKGTTVNGFTGELWTWTASRWSSSS